MNPLVRQFTSVDRSATPSPAENITEQHNARKKPSQALLGFSLYFFIQVSYIFKKVKEGVRLGMNSADRSEVRKEVIFTKA